MRTTGAGCRPAVLSFGTRTPGCTEVLPAGRLHSRRRVMQIMFFSLFVLAPPLDLFRLDLNLGHFILMGHSWTLGLSGAHPEDLDAWQAAYRLLTRVLLPLIVAVVLFIWVARNYGRLYCGWLCPHFSVVEAINGLMRRAMDRPGFWERRVLPQRRANGDHIAAHAAWWIPTTLAIVGFSFLWAVVLLTYLLPPVEIYANLLNAQLSRNQTVFLVVATSLLAMEFTLARHFFCRFGCAVGLFQSLAWMTRKDALVVGFDRDRAQACQDCDNACEHACPMRLKPRGFKRAKFTCTQCGECIRACEVIQGSRTQSLLDWSIQVQDNGSRQSILPEWKNK